MDENRTTLLTEIYDVISNERERDEEENGQVTASPFESYSLILAALERKDAAAKDLKDCVKELWSAVKDKNDGGITAYLGRDRAGGAGERHGLGAGRRAVRQGRRQRLRRREQRF